MCVAVQLGDTTSFIISLKRLIGGKKNGWLDVLSGEPSSLEESAKWVGRSERALLFTGRLLCLSVTAAGPWDCARSGAAVSQASGSRSAGWHAARDSHPKPQEIPAICHPYKITFRI